MANRTTSPARLGRGAHTRRLLFCIAFLASFATTTAGLRGPGRYSGVVIFDRWGGCILLSGAYLMYISRKAQEDLRPYTHQAIQIDAKEVDQPVNPGDGLIGRFEYLGLAPENRNWVSLKGLRLRAAMRSRDGSRPSVSMILRNASRVPARLLSGELALTLLTRKRSSPTSGSPADGPSYALITRASFGRGNWQGWGISAGLSYSWSAGPKAALAPAFLLEPGEEKEITVSFELPPGEYDFLFGYGGGVHESRSLASNLVAFNVDGKGRARAIRIAGR